MGKLNILGAQRVKALIEILQEKKAAEIAEMSASLPTRDKIKKDLELENGVALLRTELDKIIVQGNKIAEKINDITGEGRYLSQGASYSYKQDNLEKEYRKAIDEVYEGRTKSKLDEIDKKYKKKEQSLWLCESLEEAKEIVGIKETEEVDK